jgi:hypothetical protein
MGRLPEYRLDKPRLTLTIVENGTPPRKYEESVSLVFEGRRLLVFGVKQYVWR